MGDQKADARTTNTGPENTAKAPKKKRIFKVSTFHH